MFSKDQTWLDKIAYYIENFKPRLAEALRNTYEERRNKISSMRPLDDSITLQELLQQLLSCGMTKEYLYNIVTNTISPLDINIA